MSLTVDLLWQPRFLLNERLIASRLIDIGLASSLHILIAPAEPEAHRTEFYSASGALIDFGGRPCLVTNKHVVDFYRAQIALRPTVFEFAGARLDPLARLYSENDLVDLAVLRLDGLRIDVHRDGGVPRLELFKRKKWPPQPPRAGDRVFFAGWPEVGRSVDVEEREVSFRPYSWIGMEIRNAGYDQFSILFERDKFQGVTGWETPDQLAERNLSGLSGSPIFRDPSTDGRLAADLIGFVKQYNPDLDYLVATSALNLRGDGKIERYFP